MFRKLRLILPVLLVALLMAACALADDLSDFTFSINGANCTVTGYTGSATSVKVPDWYQGVRVTALGAGAFRNNTTITSVSLPSTIRTLSTSAFEGCTSLTSLTSYTASSTPPQVEESKRIPGDANDDGEADLFDALLLLQYDAGWNVTVNESNGDVNGDGWADLFDALLILQYDAGWDVTLR